MVESIANIVRAWPAERIRDGQPYLALELICGARPPRRPARDGVVDQHPLRAADRGRAGRRDQRRLPRRPARPRPRRAAPPAAGRAARARVRDAVSQGAQLRLLADRRRRASTRPRRSSRSPAPRSRSGAPSIVRFQLTPTPSFFEELARRLYRRHEQQARAPGALGTARGRADARRSTAPRCAPPSAPRTAACSGSRPSSPPTAPRRARRVAAAVQSRRGENRLHRRWMIVRQRLYRRRFPRALGPLIPSIAVLVSAAEVAHLLELPSARMKGVPVRRVTLPRIPAPPGVIRGHRTRPTSTAAANRGRLSRRPRPSGATP